MRFGNLRHKILFAKPAGTVTNGMGETVPAYSLYRPNLPEKIIKYVDGEWLDSSEIAINTKENEYSIRAEVSPLTSREYTNSQKLRAETTYRVTTRFLPDIQQDMFILYENKKLFIQSVLEKDTKCKELEIVCFEVSM